MKINSKTLIGLILITSGIGQVVLTSLNRDKILWEHNGQFPDYEGNLELKIPPNPIIGNNFVMRVSADFYNLYYMHYSNSGTINLTHQSSGKVYWFEYYLSKAEGDFDHEERRWTLLSSIYNISWVNDNCAFMYKIIKLGIGYPYNNVVFISSIVISIVFTITGIILIFLAKGFIGKHKIR